MKKALSVILSLLLLLLPLAAHCDAAQNLLEKAAVLHPEWNLLRPDVTGEWYLTALMFDEDKVNPAALELSLTITLNEDGSASMVENGITNETVTWAFNGDQLELLYEGGAKDVLTVGDEMLILADTALAFHFTRDPADAPSAFRLPPEIKAESAEAFLGEWGDCFIVDPATGLYLPASVFNSVSTLSVADGAAAFTMDNNAIDLTPRLQDGRLLLEAPQFSAVAALYEDDLLSVTIEGEILYYTRIVP